MQKKWMIAGGSVLVVAGALPWLVGYVTEQQWQQATREVNRSQPFFRLETDAYQRGFLGSELAGSLVVRNPETGASQEIDYHASVTHGVTGSLLDFQPEHGWSPEGMDWFPHESPRLTLETRLWGTATLELEAPVATITSPATGETFTSSGGLARLEISDTGSRAEALMVWPAVSLAGPDLDLRFSDIRFEQTMEHLVDDIWTGQGELVIGSATVTPAGVEPVMLRDFRFATVTEAVKEGARLDSSATVSLAEVIQGGERYGPHHLVFVLENLEVASWSAFTDGLSELQAMALADQGTDGGQVEQQMAAMQRANRALRELAAAGFSLGIPELSLSTTEGKVTGRAVISHPELTEQQKSAMLMVMQRLTGKLDLRFPLALVEESPELRLQLAPLIKQGLLVQEGDQLVMDASMQDLMVDVNGLKLPLPPLL